MIKKRKIIARWAAIAVGVMGFLLMCSETLPGVDSNEWTLLIQELVRLGLLGGAFWAASKIEGNP